MEAARRCVAMTEHAAAPVHDLVVALRAAAATHRSAWEALVPSRHEVNMAMETAEENAYADMERCRIELRNHICHSYGLLPRELAALVKG